MISALHHWVSVLHSWVFLIWDVIRTIHSTLFSYKLLIPLIFTRSNIPGFINLVCIQSIIKVLLTLFWGLILWSDQMLLFLLSNQNFFMLLTLFRLRNYSLSELWLKRTSITLLYSLCISSFFSLIWRSSRIAVLISIFNLYNRAATLIKILLFLVRNFISIFFFRT